MLYDFLFRTCFKYIFLFAESLPSAREKVLGKEGFADALCVEPSLPSATLGEVFVEYF
jgi:hypothetical protein